MGQPDFSVWGCQAHNADSLGEGRRAAIPEKARGVNGTDGKSGVAIFTIARDAGDFTNMSAMHRDAVCCSWQGYSSDSPDGDAPGAARPETGELWCAVRCNIGSVQRTTDRGVTGAAGSIIWLTLGASVPQSVAVRGGPLSQGKAWGTACLRDAGLPIFAQVTVGEG